MRGRKPQPAAVVRAKGNPGRRKVADAPEAGSGKASPPPRMLAKEAKAIWQKLSPDLTRMKLLRPTDEAAFSRYCEHLGRWWELTKDLRKEGETYETESLHGKMKRVNPKFMVRERTEKRLEVLEEKFGLTPGARMQIMQRLADTIPAMPAGGLFGEQAVAGEVTPAPAKSPIGLLNRAPVH